MSAAQASGAKLAPKENPDSLALRGKPPPTVRFRRGLIVGLSGGIVASLIGLSWMALGPPTLRKPVAPAEKDAVTASSPSEAIHDLPASYADVPRLGPPLPGDLGRPILEQQQRLAGTQQSSFNSEQVGRADTEIEAERGRVAAARRSPVIFPLRDVPRNTSLEHAETDGSLAAPTGASIGDKQSFGDVGSSPERQDGGNETAGQSSSWKLSAGTVIPASLITGLNSDVPGIVIAQVTENVRDSLTGHAVLIPQGSRLIGSYDDKIAYGQRRAFLVWTQMVLPDGSSIRLEKLTASDASGYSGVRDRVDSHSWQLLKGIAFSTLLGVGTQLSIGSGRNSLIRAIRESAQESASNAGDQITTRNLDLRPTITVRPGSPVSAILTSDLILHRWKGDL